VKPNALLANALLAIAQLVIAVAGTSCVVDSKGAVCGYIGALSDGDGALYCRDAAAPADCEAVNDAMVLAAVRCASEAGQEIDEATARADLELENCENAGATTNALPTCLDALNDDDAPPCDGAALDVPGTCRGIVLDPIFSDNLPG
jgi:hypothetical protein